MSKLLIDAFDEFGNQWALVAAGTEIGRAHV